jgi:D-3-phosphoglycerate dehydrogenase
MPQARVVITDHGFPHLRHEEDVLSALDAELIAAQCRTPEEIIAVAHDADALLVQGAPVNAAVIEALTRCRVIVRYGIGVDNIDVAAATARDIPVCNVPDYGVREVAEHAVAMALTLVRQLPSLDRRLRAGTWKITPDRPMPGLHESTFGTAGFGRIARKAHEMMGGFGCKRIAFDPYVAAEEMAEAGVEKVEREEIFTRSDILSLHLSLTPETWHFVNTADLAQMKKNAVVVNTAVGALVDTRALAVALSNGVIAGAGLDVFELEPVEKYHPLLACPTALLTSHVAWYSDSSIPRLQRFAAEEVARALRGEPLRNRVNA